MRTWTAVTPLKPTMDDEALMPLWAPVLAKEPSAPNEYVGHTEGAVLDDSGSLIGFVVRISEKLEADEPRTLVAKSALRVRDGNVLQLSWAEDQLRAQPRLDARFRLHNRVDGGPPVETQWMPARPEVIPPGEGVNAKEGAKEGLGGGIAGAAVGALAGLATGDPVGAATLAAFFAAGGGLAGFLAGASQETAVEGGELNLESSDAAADERTRLAFARLEERLRDPELVHSGRLFTTRFTPFVRPAQESEARP